MTPVKAATEPVACRTSHASEIANAASPIIDRPSPPMTVRNRRLRSGGARPVDGIMLESQPMEARRGCRSFARAPHLLDALDLGGGDVLDTPGLRP